ncbi:DUF6658 family protein [Crocosphaera chwakensis]|uniref:DUF1542 domain-containing protein n=1 Tax=Crocosphaera chwakensis CCY0110 TaxID=391612 RepID=A3IRY4_9CHRO|nr:DUF6658 family protein [Crocosphaera chwakensis]EAZ90835.1 hypothetical protein CY0110_30426 [Crocosphaera chwakensis CCY0110]
MNTLKQFFQRIKIKQLLVTLLAGVLLLTSTACSNGRTQAAAPSSGSGSPNDIGRPQPGQSIYPTSDVQKGQDTTGSDRKAKRLIEEAKKRNQKVQTPDGLVDELTPDKSVPEQAKDLGKSAQKAAKNATENTKKAAKNAAENTKEGLNNIKENTQNMVDQATDTIN